MSLTLLIILSPSSFETNLALSASLNISFRDFFSESGAVFKKVLRSFLIGDSIAKLFLINLEELSKKFTSFKLEGTYL